MAVQCEGQQWSYSELNARADVLAVRLRKIGVGPEIRVAILLERSVDLVVAVLGVLKAGGAYVPGMSDYTVFVDRRAQVFLGGPPLVKMAIDEDADEETLGGAEMHSRVSGLSDHLAVDEVDAIRLGRQIIRRLNWRKLGPPPAATVARPVLDPEELIGVAPVDV